MRRKANRNRSQALSLRISPLMRFGLECIANESKTSMTLTIERALVHAMTALTIKCPEYLSPKYEVDGKVKVSDILALAWDEDEVVRLLRTGVLESRFLSGREQMAYMFFAGKGRYESEGEIISFCGEDDVFKNKTHSMSDEYLSNGPRFDVLKCREYFESVKAAFDDYFNLDTNVLAEFVSNK